MNRFYQYIEDVTGGKVKTGSLIKLAVERHVRDIKENKFEFNTEKAKRIITFFEALRHWKGEWAGQKIILEPHQVFYLGSLFGWLRDDGSRRFRTSLKLVARKNAKTTECAGKSLYHLTADEEQGAQVYFVATKEEQARIGLNDAREITLKTPSLKSRLKVFTKAITFRESLCKPLGSDSNTQDGFDPSMGVIDEYHAHPNDRMLNVIESGMGSRRQPLIDIISTAGFNRESPCYKLRKVATEVLKGIKQDDTLLAMIFELDEGDEWEDRELWVKSNPNYKVSVKESYLDDRYIKAKNEGGTKEVDFKTKNLNIWTDSAETWIQDKTWMECDFGEVDTNGRVCFGGLDLASTRDINALVLFFPGERHVIKRFFFLPEDTVKDRSEKVDYQTWVDQGHIEETPGNVTDYNFIKARFREIAERYDLKSIAFDRWNSSQLVIDLLDEGFKMEPFGQGFASMSTPTRELEKLVLGKQINHEGDPVLRWMCSNVMLKKDPAGNIKIDKEKSHEKVDGMVALVMALGMYMNTDKEQEHAYQDGGIKFI